jgi:hypothetical protein
MKKFGNRPLRLHLAATLESIRAQKRFWRDLVRGKARSVLNPC